MGLCSFSTTNGFQPFRFRFFLGGRGGGDAGAGAGFETLNLMGGFFFFFLMIC
jgi:hypothetical protein